jgi:hypothetical protein
VQAVDLAVAEGVELLAPLNSAPELLLPGALNDGRGPRPVALGAAPPTARRCTAPRALPARPSPCPRSCPRCPVDRRGSPWWPRPRSGPRGSLRAAAASRMNAPATTAVCAVTDLIPSLTRGGTRGTRVTARRGLRRGLALTLAMVGWRVCRPDPEPGTLSKNRSAN